MRDREFPFEQKIVCECCGKQGAFDIYGDYLCGECLETPDALAEGVESGKLVEKGATQTGASGGRDEEHGR